MFLCLILNNYIVIIVILGGEKIVVKFTFTTCIDFFPCEFVVEILHTDVSFNLFARWVFLAIR